ncbi:hypothetical protein SDC9_199856 [bioreactor metagenome]|uniref:Transporter YfdV n=1 Tax=bioreactor metagenome TaxID=1076179 RepID=A0A645IM82_9ZZZZ
MNEFLDKILSTLSPLALFSIGLQLKFGEWRAESKNLLVGLSYKLIVAPLIIFIFVMLTHSTGYFSKVIVFEASMPSHITASLLASQFELNPRLCNLMVGIGIIASFLTSTIWYFVCNNFM